MKWHVLNKYVSCSVTINAKHTHTHFEEPGESSTCGHVMWLWNNGVRGDVGKLVWQIKRCRLRDIEEGEGWEQEVVEQIKVQKGVKIKQIEDKKALL